MEANLKHTPTPWTVYEGDTSIFAGGSVIAEFYGTEPVLSSKEEREIIYANARIGSTAPDGYRLAQLVVHEYGVTRNEYARHILRNLYPIACEIIQKAEGIKTFKKPSEKLTNDASL